MRQHGTPALQHHRAWKLLLGAQILKTGSEDEHAPSSPANILFLPPLDPGLVTALIPSHLPRSHECSRERGACRVLFHAQRRALRDHKPRSSSLLTMCISRLTAPLQLFTVSHPISHTLGRRTAHISSSPGCQEHQQTHTPNSFAPDRAPCLSALPCSGQSCRKPTAAHGQQQS